MRNREGSAKGFSLVELVVVVAVILVLIAVAMPSFLVAFRSYQLSGAAIQVADVVSSTRFEAIRLNKQINCLIQLTGSSTQMWADSNRDGIAQSSEKQILLSGNLNLAPAGSVPNTAGLAAAIGVTVLTAVSTTNGAIAFDARGALNPAGVYVLYVFNSAVPSAGYRAVILLPTGSIQIWAADNAGNWHEVN